MKKIALLFLLALAPSLIFSQKLKKVTSFKGQQVTGVSVSEKGKIFANFPRWSEDVNYSVVEVKNKNKSVPYPNASWNSWKPGDQVVDSAFVSVQSVVASKDKLYVLDTRNPLWKGVVDAPRIFVFDLKTNALSAIYILSEDTYKPNSYVNDLRVDEANGNIYMTDSNEAGLIVYNMKTNNGRRVLDQHFSTTAELDHLMIDGEKWGPTPVHSDGIALDKANDMLYFHALKGYSLYSVPGKLLREGTLAEIEENTKKIANTPAPDGMIFDKNGNLYLADLENHSIVYLTPAHQIKTLIQDQTVGWADTFSIYKDDLYFTNSKIHETKNGVEELVFPIYKIKLPQ